MNDELGAVAERVRRALEHADLEAFGDLLDPDVHWGPADGRAFECKNRDEVLAWYGRGREAGGRAEVTEVAVCGDRLLVGLLVSGTRAARARGGATRRWQVLSLKGGRIVDIRGFDERSEAAARIGLEG